MKVAYLILTHNSAEHLKRLIQALDTNDSSFFVHVDKKTDESTFKEMSSEEGPNISFVKRHACHWGDIGIIEATLECLNQALVSGTDFEYFILLSGQDYPIKTNEQIRESLQKSNNFSFMGFNEMPYRYWKNGGMYRFRNWHLKWFKQAKSTTSLLTHRMWCVLSSLNPVKRKIPFGFRPYGGSQWWCLTKECVEHIVRFSRENVDYKNFFKYVLIPDEIFFQTIVANSPFINKVVNNNLRYIDWSKKSNRGSPAVLSKDDFENIVSSDKMFARKFGNDIEVLNMIDNYLLTHNTAEQ